MLRSDLKLTETDTISSERQHADLLSGLEGEVELSRTETREPLNPRDLAKVVVTKDQVEEDIQAFDR